MEKPDLISKAKQFEANLENLTKKVNFLSKKIKKDEKLIDDKKKELKVLRMDKIDHKKRYNLRLRSDNKIEETIKSTIEAINKTKNELDKEKKSYRKILKDLDCYSSLEEHICELFENVQ